MEVMKVKDEDPAALVGFGKPNKGAPEFESDFI